MLTRTLPVMLAILAICAPALFACSCDLPSVDTSPPPAQELDWAELQVENQNATTSATLDSITYDISFSWSDAQSLHAHFVIVRMRVYVDGDAAGTNLGNGVFDGQPADELVADLDTSNFGWPVGLGINSRVQQTVPTTLTLTQPITIPNGLASPRTVWVRLVTGPAGTSYDTARDMRMVLSASSPQPAGISVSGVPMSDVIAVAAQAGILIYGERTIGACAHGGCGSHSDCSTGDSSSRLLASALSVLLAGVYLRRRRGFFPW